MFSGALSSVMPYRTQPEALWLVTSLSETENGEVVQLQAGFGFNGGRQAAGIVRFIHSFGQAAVGGLSVCGVCGTWTQL